ncbi:MAG: apolipoprotein N-acyltransferase [Thermoguttaceae bacterium]|nr:apolipoprotein N-acyltransferase [Thermoguttaceae bacterium]
MKHYKPFLITLASVLFFYLSLPPANLAYLCFLPPIFWIFLIRGDFAPAEKPDLSGSGFFVRFIKRCGYLCRTFYGQIFIADLIFWGISISWLPIPHPAIWAGWAPLSIVMAFYFLLYIAAARRFLRRWKMPLFLASPLAWIGMEWLRKHILTGFSFCSLEHALYLHPVMIQTAEWAGEYGVGALIMLIATSWGIGLESFISVPRRPQKGIVGILGGILLLAGMIAYGFYAVDKIDRICARADAAADGKINIALLQDSTYYHFPIPTETTVAVHQHYISLTETAAREKPDLIVWPEGTFAYPYYDFEPGAKIPSPTGSHPLSAEETETVTQKIKDDQKDQIETWLKKVGVPVILGLISTVYEPDRTRVYNSALYCAEGGSYLRYDKRARVVFGEFVPFMEYLPDSFPIKTLCEPISAGKRLGLVPVASKYQALVSICFESCYARFVRSQLDELKNSPQPVDPDFLINISSDAWFFGNAENEFHNSSYPLRAVETRKYYLVASHGGTSLGITPSGRVFTQGKHGGQEVVMARFTPVKIRPFLDGKGLWFGVICSWPVVIVFLPFPRKKKTVKEN